MAEDAKVEKEAGEKEDAVLTRAQDRFKIAIDAESENRLKELDDLKFLAASPDDHWQWPDTIYNLRTAPGQEGGPRPCLTINKLPQHHRQVTNEQKMNRPQIRVQPVDDVADPKTAKMINGYLRHMQVACEADLAFDMAGDAQVAHGAGYFRILTDYCDERSFDQDILIRPLPDRFKVYMDPEGLKKHPAGRECRWGFIIEDMPKEEYEREYGDEHALDWNDSAIGDLSDWFPDKNTVRVAEYFEIEEKKDTLCLYQVGDQLVAALKSEPMPRGVPRGARAVKERKTTVPKCIWRKLTGQKELSKKEMPTKYIPIVRMVGNQFIVEGKPVISGIVRNAKDAQRMYNYNSSSEAELNAIQPLSPFVAMAEQIEGHEDMWRQANRVKYGALLYNAVIDEATGQIVTVAPPARAQPAMPQAAIIAAKMAAGDDIKATTGQYDPSLGNRSNETSGKAINARKVQSEVGTFHYIDNYARALRYAGTIILDMMPKVIDTRRVLRILGEDGTPDHVMVDPGIQGAYQEVADEQGKKLGEVYNLQVGKYDIVVSTGPSFATQREEARTMLVELSQGVSDPIQSLAMRYLTVKNMDWSGAQEMADFLKKMLPPQLLEENEDGQEIPPQAKAMLDEAKQSVAHAAGQLQAANQALAEKEQELQAARSTIQTKGMEADARAQEQALKVREAELRVEAEREKVKGVIAQAQANIKSAEAQVIAAQTEAKGALDAAAPQNQAVEKMAEGVLAVCAQIANAINQQSAVLAELTAVNKAPKKTSLITDEMGRPVGAVSQPVLQ